MSQNQPPQLPPTGEIQKLPSLTFENWFEYAIRAQPHHTDYAGVVWHGAYVAWLEEARVECLRSIGVDYANLVAMGCELPVVELSIRYHRPIQLGMAAIVKTRMIDISGVRINWDYQIQSPDFQDLYVSAQVVLVAIDREKGKIMRQLPAAMEEALARLAAMSEK
ncbi:acyl-CoA thioesterase [Synechocystis sp. PCC 7509]|uniref:acyl-CoA thioesterase n=1 Tax=Synechocystis sp. PCC 7509 TaxID=927677 RepID=UPI0002AC20A7|nr:thioesterase family protein [Synechocystis sp. PCC 7509]